MTSVAVVVPVYNGRGTLPRCLESLLEQSLRPQAVYVVDNGSTDGTWEWLQAYAPHDPMFRILQEAQRGPGAARNAGIRAAMAEGDAEFLAFTDADCVAERRWLESLVSGFESGRIGAVTGRIQPRVPAGLVGAYLHLSALDPGTVDRVASSPSLENGIAGGNACVRVRALEEVGLFEETLLVAQDWDLGLRILEAGWQIRYTTAAVVNHLHSERTGMDLLRLAAKYGRGRPAILARHFRGRVFLLAPGRRMELRGLLTGSVHVASPEKVVATLFALAIYLPWAWAGLAGYAAYLALRLRSAARARGGPQPLPWQLPALVAMQLAEAAVANWQAFRVGLKQGVVCL